MSLIDDYLARGGVINRLDSGEGSAFYSKERMLRRIKTGYKAGHAAISERPETTDNDRNFRKYGYAGKNNERGNFHNDFD